MKKKLVSGTIGDIASSIHHHIFMAFVDIFRHVSKPKLAKCVQCSRVCSTQLLGVTAAFVHPKELEAQLVNKLRWQLLCLHCLLSNNLTTYRHIISPLTRVGSPKVVHFYSPSTSLRRCGCQIPRLSPKSQGHHKVIRKELHLKSGRTSDSLNDLKGACEHATLWIHCPRSSLVAGQCSEFSSRMTSPEKSGREIQEMTHLEVTRQVNFTLRKPARSRFPTSCCLPSCDCWVQHALPQSQRRRQAQRPRDGHHGGDKSWSGDIKQYSDLAISMILHYSYLYLLPTHVCKKSTDPLYLSFQPGKRWSPRHSCAAGGWTFGVPTSVQYSTLQTTKTVPPNVTKYQNIHSYNLFSKWSLDPALQGRLPGWVATRNFCFHKSHKTIWSIWKLGNRYIKR